MRSLVRLQKLQDDHARATGGADSIPRRQDDDGELLDVGEELTVQQPPLAEPLWLTADY